MESDDRDEFVDQHLNRKQERTNKRKNNRNHQRGDGGKKIHRVGGGKERWHFNRNADYEEEAD